MNLCSFVAKNTLNCTFVHIDRYTSFIKIIFHRLIINAACSSKNLNWYNESLIVPNGSYALTANNCIKCNCGTSDLNLQCFPSGIAVPCSHLQCKGSNLFIGDAYVNQTAAGCNVSTNNTFHAGKQNYSAASPLGSPSSPNPLIPFITVTPSPSPFPGSTRTIGIASFGPTSTQYSNMSNNGGLLGKEPPLNFLPFALPFEALGRTL
ncbi:lysm domain-containing gpi-anchored protein 1 [Quercus suber]|uniref:Lysm domain-containing gpi-anchored protein 1 n=1 Tax=Quercus suber TaxID=58331 RepID=A0AAW0LX05_QUESU